MLRAMLRKKCCWLLALTLLGCSHKSIDTKVARKGAKRNAFHSCGAGCSGQVAKINKLGDEGWEVVTVNASNRILLRLGLQVALCNRSGASVLR